MQHAKDYWTVTRTHSHTPPEECFLPSTIETSPRLAYAVGQFEGPR